MELRYSRNGDYLIPDLTLPRASTHPIGKYGRLRKRYLEEHRPALYAHMNLAGTLWQHLAETERTAQDRIALIVPAIAKREGVTEALKAENQLEWVRQMNSIQAMADKIILSELVYL